MVSLKILRHSSVAAVRGISVQPVGFLVIANEQVRLIPVCGATPLDKAIEAVPIIAEQVQNIIDKKNRE